MDTSELSVTLHWEQDGESQSGTATFPDGTPTELIPLLAECCDLPVFTPNGATPAYVLRLNAANRPPLVSDVALSAQGVRTGSHLWLTPAPVRRPSPLRCLLSLPDGTGIVIGQRGQAITRAWLLDLLRLLHPEEYRRQEAAGDASPYCYVSNSRPHCTIRYGDGGEWLLHVDRDDVLTSVNGRPQTAGAVARLEHGDQLTLGDSDGLHIEVELM